MASCVYKFFNVPEIRGTKLRAQCKQCNASISKTKGVTLNLLKHLRVSYLIGINYLFAFEYLVLSCFETVEFYIDTTSEYKPLHQ